MEVQKHSGLGIASFIISCVSGIAMFSIFVAAGLMQAAPGGIDERSSSAVVLGLGIFAFIGMTLVALGIGIAGLAQKERKKLFAVLGVVFSVTTIVCTAGLMLIGLAAS